MDSHDLPQRLRPSDILAIALIMALIVSYTLFAAAGEQLLSAPPKASFPLIFIVGAVVGGYCAYVILRVVSGGLGATLVRRVGTIMILALSIFATAQSYRGIYASRAFAGPISAHQELWPLLPFQAQSDEVKATRPGTTRPIAFAAAPSANVSAMTGKLGLCATVSVERSASGAERIATNHPTLAADDISPCPEIIVKTAELSPPQTEGFTFVSKPQYRSNASESAEEQAAADAIRAHNAELMRDYPTP